MVLFHYSSHTICSSTFLVFLLDFHRCHFLNRQISSGTSSGSLHPYFRELPSHHSNTSIRADVPYSLADFPPSAEFLNANVWDLKKIFWVQEFSAIAFSVSNAVHSPLFCSSGDLVREDLFARSVGSRNRYIETETRENPGKPKSNYTRLNVLKVTWAYSAMEIKQHSGLGRREQIVFGRYVKYNCDYPLKTKWKTEKFSMELDHWRQLIWITDFLIARIWYWNYPKTLLPDLQLACSTWTQPQSEIICCSDAETMLSLEERHWR